MSNKQDKKTQPKKNFEQNFITSNNGQSQHGVCHRLWILKHIFWTMIVSFFAQQSYSNHYFVGVLVKNWIIKRSRFSCISFVMDRYPIWGMFYTNHHAWRIPSLDKVYLGYLLFLTIGWWTLLDVWFLNPLTSLLLIRLTYKNVSDKKQGNLFFEM